MIVVLFKIDTNRLKVIKDVLSILSNSCAFFQMDFFEKLSDLVFLFFTKKFRKFSTT